MLLNSIFSARSTNQEAINNLAKVKTQIINFSIKVRRTRIPDLDSSSNPPSPPLNFQLHTEKKTSSSSKIKTAHGHGKWRGKIEKLSYNHHHHHATEPQRRSCPYCVLTLFRVTTPLFPQPLPLLFLPILPLPSVVLWSVFPKTPKKNEHIIHTHRDLRSRASQSVCARDVMQRENKINITKFPGLHLPPILSSFTMEGEK